MSRHGLGGGAAKAASETFRATSAVSAEEQGSLNFDDIDLREIDPDPTNERTKDIDWNEFKPLLNLIPPQLITNPKNANYDATAVSKFSSAITAAITKLECFQKNAKLFEGLFSLAANIRVLGVLQPIEVVKEGRRYHITFGHRRYFASIIAGKRYIPARVRIGDTSRKHKQSSENLMQESLPLMQKIRQMQSAIAELGLEENSSADEACLLLGIKERTYYRYKTVGQSPLVMAAIEVGLVNNLKKAEELASLTEAECQVHLERLRAGEVDTPILNLLEPIEEEGGSEPISRKRGRPKLGVTTPKITNTAIIASIMGRYDFDGIHVDDWSDLTKVNKAWKKFLKKVERECQTNKG